jgi:hypothetical protein
MPVANMLPPVMLPVATTVEVNVAELAAIFPPVLLATVQAANELL